MDDKRPHDAGGAAETRWELEQGSSLLQQPEAPPAKKSRIEGDSCKYVVVAVNNVALAALCVDDGVVPWDDQVTAAVESTDSHQRIMCILALANRQTFVGYGIYLGAKSTRDPKSKEIPATWATLVKVGWARMSSVPWGSLISKLPATASVSVVTNSEGRAICDAIENASHTVLPTDLKVLHQNPQNASAVAMRNIHSTARGGASVAKQGYTGTSHRREYNNSSHNHNKQHYDGHHHQQHHHHHHQQHQAMYYGAHPVDPYAAQQQFYQPHDPQQAWQQWQMQQSHSLGHYDHQQHYQQQHVPYYPDQQPQQHVTGAPHSES